MACTQIVEPADPHTWNDNYLCWGFIDRRFSMSIGGASRASRPLASFR